MSEATIPVLLVAGRPALATRLQALLAAPPLALADRASSATAAVARAGRGDLAAAVLAADTRDLTPAALAALVAAGLRVALVADDPAAVPPELAAAGAAVVATAALDDGEALARALTAAVAAARTPTAAAATAPPTADAITAPVPTAPPRPAPGAAPATGARAALPLPRAWARRRAIQTAMAPGARSAAPAGAAIGGDGLAERPAVPRPGVATPTPATRALAAAIIGVQGERGGPGASTLARALAARLARGGDDVLLLDLDPAGDSLAGAWALDHPGAGLAALAGLARADEPAWAAALGREVRAVAPRLRALPGLPGPAEAAHVPEAAVTRLLDWARGQAGWVVVDLGRWAGLPWQAAARAACADLLLVLAPTRAALLAAQGSLAAAGELGAAPPGRALVLGKGGDADEVRPDEAAAALGWPVLARLPANPAALAWGADPAAPPDPADDPYGQALIALAVALGADPGPAAAPARAPRRLRLQLPALRWPPGRPARPSHPRRPLAGGVAPGHEAG